MNSDHIHLFIFWSWSLFLLWVCIRAYDGCTNPSPNLEIESKYFRRTMTLVYSAVLSAYVYTYVALHIRRCLKWQYPWNMWTPNRLWWTSFPHQKQIKASGLYPFCRSRSVSYSTKNDPMWIFRSSWKWKQLSSKMDISVRNERQHLHVDSPGDEGRLCRKPNKLQAEHLSIFIAITQACYICGGTLKFMPLNSWVIVWGRLVPKSGSPLGRVIWRREFSRHPAEPLSPEQWGAVRHGRASTSAWGGLHGGQV